MALMLRWLDGVRPESGTFDQVTEVKKRVRELKNHWMYDGPWQKYDTFVKLMFCSYCKAISLRLDFPRYYRLEMQSRKYIQKSNLNEINCKEQGKG